MINDNCDKIGCGKRALYEVEHLETRDCFFVCKPCLDYGLRNKHIKLIRENPNQFEKHIYQEVEE